MEFPYSHVSAPSSSHADQQELPSFFLYEHPALDHSWMERECSARLDALLLSAHGRLAAEVGLHRSLRAHPKRTRKPENADLFYVPVFEYVSFKLAGQCQFSGEAWGAPSQHGNATRLNSHKTRMEAATSVLLASPYWRRRGGSDHFFASTAYNHPSPMAYRMAPLNKALRCAIAGRYREFLFADKHSAKSAVGLCTVTLPYVSPLQSALATQAAGHAVGEDGVGSVGRLGLGRRARFLYFAGALDVCCYGRDVRCKVGVEPSVEPSALCNHDVLRRP